MSQSKRVHRNLELPDIARGNAAPDVLELRRAITRELGHRRLGYLALFGGRRAHATKVTVAHVVFVLGLSDGVRKAALRGHVGKATQRKIRNPRLRTPAERRRDRRRRPVVAKWREKHREKTPSLMYDSVNVDEIPPDAPAVAGYVGGAWPTFEELEHRFPSARLVSIAVASQYDADFLDVEPGDATPADVPDWVKRQIRRGSNFIGVYAAVSQIPEVRDILRGAELLDRVALWSAHVGEGKHVCGPSTCGFPGIAEGDVAGTQHDWTALGRNLDESLLTDAFWR